MSLYPDISHYHPVANWSHVKQNAGFLISKATQGTGYVDNTLDGFIQGCEAHGIPYWLYTYLNKGNELAQAQFMVNTCKGKVGKHFVGYVLDVEAGNSADGVQQALNYLIGLGGKVMLYTAYKDFSLYARVISNRPGRCAWWEARYGKNDGAYNSAYPCHNGVDLHQYTSVGSCPGISGKIDLNRLTGAKPEPWFTNGISGSASGSGIVSTSAEKATVNFTYAVRTEGGKILPEVTNLSDYAGIKGKRITDIAIKCDKGSLWYQVHVLGGGWLPKVTGYNWSDHNNGYAGNGKTIDAVRVYYSTPNDIVSKHGYQKAQYHVSPVGQGYYDWQFDNETGNGQDGYAGCFGRAIDRFQLY